MASCSEYLDGGRAAGKLHSDGTVPSRPWSIGRREGAAFSIRMIDPTFQDGTSPPGGVFRSFSFHEYGVNDNDTDNKSGFLRRSASFTATVDLPETTSEKPKEAGARQS